MASLQHPATVSAPKTDEFSLKLFQAIFCRLGRSATHDQSFHVRAVFCQGPLSFGERLTWGENNLVASWCHHQNVRLNA